MQIAKNTVVSMDYTLKDDQGTVMDSSVGYEPLEYLQGYDNIIPGLERQLEGKSAGDKMTVTVKPEDGYGQYIQELIINVPKTSFQDMDDMAVGMQVEMMGAEDEPMVMTIKSINEEDVTLDGNHPLAGMSLNFDVEIINVREATAEEIERGHLGDDCCDDDCCDDDHHHHHHDDEEGCGSGCAGCSCGH